MPPPPGRRAADTQLARLGAELLERITRLVEAMAARIRDEVNFYAEAVAGLRDNCRLNPEFVLRGLGGGNVPLPAVMDAYRVGSRFIWDAFVDEAATSGQPDSDTLVRAASEVWMLQDTFTQAMAAGYRDATAARVFTQEQERSAFVGVLLKGRIKHTTIHRGRPNRGRLAGHGVRARTGGPSPWPVPPRSWRTWPARYPARSLTAPADVTELCPALEAARQQAGWPAASGRIPAL